MKITHVIESSGGSADFVLYLIKHIPQHSHTVIYGERTFGEKVDEVAKKYSNVALFHWKHAQREIGLWSDLKATIFLFELLKNVESDIIHLHSSKAGFIGRLVCYLQGKRNVIYTPNGLAFLRLDVSSFKRKMYVLLEKAANWLTGKVVACSRSEAQALIDHGINSSFINNGTEISECEAEIEKKQFIIATSGRITIQKNPALFNKIAEQFEDVSVKFLWIGGGELQGVLTSSNIRITGWVDRSTVLRELSQVDTYVSTAAWEGLPFAVLEAMNLCKPLLLTNCVGNVDLVENGYNGFTYNTFDEAVEKINLLIGDKKLKRLLGMNSKDLVIKHFNVESMASLYEETYMTLILRGE